MINVLLADDHKILRDGLKRIIEDTEKIEVTDEANNGDEVLQKIIINSFDVIVMDISMPNKNGLETLKEMRSQNINIPVLIISMYPESQYAFRLIKAGANGYLTKESASDELIDAIESVAKGRFHISDELAYEMATFIGTKQKSITHENLTDREYQVMLLIGEGDRVNDIAIQLDLSPKTISTYRSRILQKMKMEKTSDIIRYVILNNLNS